MEMILINSAKLKVMLSENDLRPYSLTCDTIDYSNDATKRAFRDILDTAKKKTGFDAEGAKVYIQVFPVRSGAVRGSGRCCELFVTKLPDTENETETGTGTRTECKCRAGRDGDTSPASGEREQGSGQRKYIFVFDSFDSLVGACRGLCSCAVRSDSGAAAEGEKYYLTLFPGWGGNDLTFVGEFGRPLGAGTETLAEAYFSEHALYLLRTGAVETLASL